MHNNKTLTIKNLGIDTYRENIIYMRSDCHVCRSEGFTALTRVVVHCMDRSIVATLNVVQSELLRHGEAGLSTVAIKRLEAKKDNKITVSHLQPIPSVGLVRAKMYGKELTETELEQIVGDISKGHYSNIELAAFITATSGNHLSTSEIIGLTRAMVRSGEKLTWDGNLVYDKHCIGGLPGNRTTPIVISIAASAGLTIPKTSSRAITSPAGTADTMEVMTNVELTMSQMKEVVTMENGCLVWGGSVSLSPADDILISVEKALDIDSEGQMIASVLSKKAAAGATHVIIDIPVGETAKIRSESKAKELKELFEIVGKNIGLVVKVIITDGSQPIGRGIGPALEAMDVLSVLRNEHDAPEDLKQRAILIAGELLELSGKSERGKGVKMAAEILTSGLAHKKLMSICEAQGRFTEPSYADFCMEVLSEVDGIVERIDTRKIAKLAKLAGAPKSPKAGVLFNAPLNKQVKKGDVLLAIYAEAKGELDYALEYYRSQTQIIVIK
ncbi:thymidine phosphorylase [Cyclobacterium lianum]|uniref:thymidine phosphorylase n=1 Tax=Cyclobacterium lianum TaxID=388280 RepID=A0A1M7P762_9BACT|nr:thymidine phosphorylase family protein [Cyclobacterium lianum]SHN12000.1 thymidine phosphorylase [Cyclobacterium lianum]